MFIHHRNGQNVVQWLDQYPEVYYMKKWWLEYAFQDAQGRNLQFRGWINTCALNRHDFPETLEGTFWVSKVEENGFLRNGDIGMNGNFDIGFGEENNHVIGSVYPVYLSEGVNFAASPSREGAEMILKALTPVPRFERFEARIEDCLVLSKTYIDEVRL